MKHTLLASLGVFCIGLSDAPAASVTFTDRVSASFGHVYSTAALPGGFPNDELNERINAASETDTQLWLDPNAVFEVPHFDPALGALTRMSYRLDGAVETRLEGISYPDFEIINDFFSAAESGIGRVETKASNTLAAALYMFATPIDLYLGTPLSADCGFYVALSGTETCSFSTAKTSSFLMGGSFEFPQLLDFLSTPGTLQIALVAESVLSASNAQTVLANHQFLDTNGRPGAELSVTYHYALAAIPLPPSAAMLAGGLGVLAMLAHARRFGRGKPQQG